jgi:MFS family permease
MVALSKYLGFAGPRFGITVSWVMNIFLFGYAVFAFFGGVLTRKSNPKTIVIVMMALWSLITLLTGWVTGLALLLFYRLILGMAEGVYYPQQSRFVKAFFSNNELSRANAMLNYYGQNLGLGFGYLILTPIFQSHGWRSLFVITGVLGLIVIVPLFIKFLKFDPKSELGSQVQIPKFSFAEIGGPPTLFALFTYMVQSSLFWGISLWIPMVTSSLHFTGASQTFFNALPYFAAIVLGWPMAVLSDRTGKRALITALGLFIPGALMMVLPLVNDPVWKMVIITIALSYCMSSFLPNILAILQYSVKPSGVGSVIGMATGLGAVGGIIASTLVGWLYMTTHSYMPGLALVGFLVMLGGVTILLHDRYRYKETVTA